LRPATLNLRKTKKSSTDKRVMKMRKKRRVVRKKSMAVRRNTAKRKSL